MWYVIQTLTGREDENAALIRRDVVIQGEDAFVLENERLFRIKGNWEKIRKPLFPGYLFVETQDAEDFRRRLRSKHLALWMLQADNEPMPIYPEEEAYLKHIGGADHIARYSEGYRIGDRIEIETGAFAGYKGEIRRLDRHNRRARIVIPLMGRDIEVVIGLGIVKNIPLPEDRETDRKPRIGVDASNA